MRMLRILALSSLAIAATASAASADVQLTLQNGRVSLVARDATLRQILAEWARVGQTKIVNAERVPGGPLSIELIDVPEREALDILLRSLSGYVAAPRPAMVANLSQFDRIVVMPTSAPPPSPMRAAANPPPTFPQANAFPPPGVVEDDQEGAPPAPVRAPVFNAYPQPQLVNGNSPASNQLAPAQGPLTLPQQGTSQPQQYTAPTSPYGGVAVPGMIATPPPQPGQVVAPGQVPAPGQTPQSGVIQPPKRPGGI